MRTVPTAVGEWDAAGWEAICTDAVVSAHRCAGSAAASVTAAEAVTEAAVTALAVRHARAVPGDEVVAALAARRVAELVLGTAADLAVAVPAWDAGETLLRARPLLSGFDRWAHLLAARPLVPSVSALLDAVALPAARAEDLHASLAERAAAIAAGVPAEWAGPPEVPFDVLAAALPLLGRPVADLALAVALAEDGTVDDVIVRRFVYRRFGEATAEGLTPRHLERSRELVEAFLAPLAAGAPV